MPFTGPDQVTLEKSPAYFVGKLVPARVHKMNPRIKLIVVVRNPITRAVSGLFFIIRRTLSIQISHKRSLAKSGKSNRRASKS